MLRINGQIWLICVVVLVSLIIVSFTVYANPEEAKYIRLIDELQATIDAEPDPELRSAWEVDMEGLTLRATTNARPTITSEERQTQEAEYELWKTQKAQTATPETNQETYKFPLPNGITDQHIYEFVDQEGFLHHNVFVSQDQNVYKVVFAGVSDEYVVGDAPHGVLDTMVITMATTIEDIKRRNEWFIAQEATGAFSVVEQVDDILLIESAGYGGNPGEMFEFDLSKMAFKESVDVAFERIENAYPVPVSKSAAENAYPAPLTIDKSSNEIVSSLFSSWATGPVVLLVLVSLSMMALTKLNAK